MPYSKMILKLFNLLNITSSVSTDFPGMCTCGVFVLGGGGRV